jgi:hypothetical protein
VATVLVGAHAPLGGDNTECRERLRSLRTFQKAPLGSSAVVLHYGPLVTRDWRVAPFSESLMLPHQALLFRILSLFVEQLSKLQTTHQNSEQVRKRA